MTCADAADLDGLWPAGAGGRLLITAADPATVAGERRVLAMPVPAFSTREAMGYLFDRLTTDPDQRSGAFDLAADLGGEPAALAQAGAVIASSGLPCRDYQHLFAQRRAQLAAAGTEPPAAAVTWTLSADYAEHLAPGAGTWPLLVLSALLDSHGIPGTVLTRRRPASTWARAPRARRTPSRPGRRCWPWSAPGWWPSARRAHRQRSG